MKREYMKPCVRLNEILMEPFLNGSTETLRMDQNDGTDEALSREGRNWED